MFDLKQEISLQSSGINRLEVRRYYCLLIWLCELLMNELCIFTLFLLCWLLLVLIAYNLCV
jgi:hypothetical protein